MKHLEDVNDGGTKWISLLETKRELVRQMKQKYKGLVILPKALNCDTHTLSELRKHIRRNSI